MECPDGIFLFTVWCSFLADRRDRCAGFRPGAGQRLGFRKDVTSTIRANIACQNSRWFNTLFQASWPALIYFMVAVPLLIHM